MIRLFKYSVSANAVRTVAAFSLILCLAAYSALGTPASAQKIKSERSSDPIEAVEAGDPEMNAAIAQAQRTLPQWLAILADPPASVVEIGFKYPLAGWEHIWVGSVRLDGDVLIGKLSNNPYNEGFKRGDVVRVPLADVSDWAYRDAGGVTQGHFTTKVLLPRLSAEEAASVRQYYGWTE